MNYVFAMITPVIKILIDFLWRNEVRKMELRRRWDASVRKISDGNKDVVTIDYEYDRLIQQQEDKLAKPKE